MGECVGLPLDGFPDDVMPLSAVVVVKALDSDGEVSYYARATENLLVVEAVGMIEYANAKLRQFWEKSGPESD